MMKEVSDVSRSGSVEIITDEDEAPPATSTLFSLKWNGFKEQICEGYASLLFSGDLADVTLACDGKLIKAHKVVLAMCSPFFKKIFTENPCKHPIVIIKGIKFREVNNLLHFIYLGEVRVQKHEISEFFEAADSLKIDGLDFDHGQKYYGKPAVPNDDLVDKRTPTEQSEDPQRYERVEQEDPHSYKPYEKTSTSTNYGRYVNPMYSPTPSPYHTDGVHARDDRKFSEDYNNPGSMQVWTGPGSSDQRSRRSDSSEDNMPVIPPAITTKGYRPNSTAVRADINEPEDIAAHHHSPTTEAHFDPREVDLSMHHRAETIRQFKHHREQSRSLPDSYESSMEERSNSSSGKQYAHSLPESVQPHLTSPGVIMPNVTARPARTDFEPKWENDHLTSPPIAPTTSHSITNHGEPFGFITPSTSGMSSSSYTVTSCQRISAEQNPICTLPLSLIPKSTVSSRLMLPSHTSVTTTAPLSLNLSGQQRLPTPMEISTSSPRNTPQSQSVSYSSAPSSKPHTTSTLSALRAKIASGGYSHPYGRLKNYHYHHHSTSGQSGQSTSASMTSESRTAAVFSRRGTEMPNPKTKQIRSSQVPPSSRYTATEVDAMVDQVQHYPGNLVPCALCQKVVKRERLRAHIHECHLLHGERIICPHCGIGLKSKGSFRVHIWRHKRGTLSSRLQPS